MRVLVTGHLGYIGTVLTRSLLTAGHEVEGLDADLYAGCTLGDPGAIVPVPARILDVRDVKVGDLAGYEAVVHLAGLSNDSLSDLDPALTRAINAEASIRLAQAAKAARVGRFLFASSCSVYGARGGALLTEDSALAPVSAYGASKIEAERGIAALADASFSPTFLRPGTAYGMSPRHRFDLLLNNLVAWATTTGVVRLKSDGQAWRPVVHVEDIAQAFCLALAAPAECVAGRVFNVGATSENYRVGELAELVVRTVPDSRLEYAQGAGADARDYRVDFTRISRELGFTPRWTAREGITALREGYRDAGLTPAVFEGPRFSRVAHLRARLAAGKLTPDLRPRT